MSAFVVSNEHVNAILTWALERGVSVWDAANNETARITEHNADRLGQVLMDENCRSFNHRYRSENVDALDYAFKPFPVMLTAAETIQACHCLDYQSCETDDWQGTAAAQILQGIAFAAAYDLSKEAGADVWEISSPSTKLANAGKAKRNVQAR